MQEIKICSLFGHRKIEASEELYTLAKSEIMKAIDFGCRIFYFGGYGEFDALCYKIAKKLQEEKNELDIKLIYCVSMEKYSKKQKNKIIVNLYKTL